VPVGPPDELLGGDDPLALFRGRPAAENGASAETSPPARTSGGPA